MLMKRMRAFLHTFLQHPAVWFVYRTLYYLFVLLALLSIYGFVEQNPQTHFIYNAF
jgi:hypothetical protein